MTTAEINARGASNAFNLYFYVNGPNKTGAAVFDL